MKSENISDAIGLLDEEILSSYNNLKLKQRRNIYIKWIAVAACICILVITAFYIGLKPVQKDSPTYIIDRHELFRNDISFVPDVTESSSKPISDTPMPTHTPIVTETPTSTGEPIVEAIKPLENTISEYSYFQNTVEQPVSTMGPSQNSDIVMDSVYWYKRWENDWTYFLSIMKERRGNGVFYSPLHKVEASSVDSEGTIDSEDDFIRKSSWQFSVLFEKDLYSAAKTSVSKKDIVNCLGIYLLNAHEQKITDLDFCKEVKIYKIKGIPIDIAIAVKLSDEEYYMFYNTNYEAKNFSTFLRDYNLINTSDIKQIAIFDNENPTSASTVYDVDNDSAIWELLLSGRYGCKWNLDLKRPEDEADIHLCLDNELYKNYDFTISLYREGYVYIRWFDKICVYLIDEKVVEDIYNSYQP